MWKSTGALILERGSIDRYQFAKIVGSYSKIFHQANNVFDICFCVISYNTKEMTLDCLRSIINATPTSLRVQIIVVDNASRDGSPEAIAVQFDTRIELIRNGENVGFAKANNQAFRLARAPFVLLLNSDTIVLGDVLSRSLEYMNAHEEVGAFGCQVLNTDRSVQLTCYSFPSIIHLLTMALGVNRLPPSYVFGRYQMLGWNRDSERDVDTISGCYLLVRKEVIESVGPLDEKFFFFWRGSGLVSENEEIWLGGQIFTCGANSTSRWWQRKTIKSST